ncbi:MAG TPA: winged helix-turn-helix domain-containing protein [Solirubrobacteraceae bacterium]|nr:winged helix-turn-helix domain-containing protein [Solirubrobacteraceae bacterium]
MADRPHPGVLVIHPDARLRDEVASALTDRGFTVTATAREPAVGAAGASTVVADHTQLPLETPGQVLALVPTHEQGAILAAFAAGADDVLAGPLRPAELASRVCLLARSAVAAQTLSVGPLTIDTFRRRATLDGRPLELTRTEYALLAALASAPGRVFTKQELSAAIAADRSTPPPDLRSARPNRRVDTQAARLRRRLGEHRGLLVTVWGVGYRLG